MKKKILIVCLLIVFVLCCFVACDLFKKGDDPETPDTGSKYDVVDDDEAHYVVFMADGKEVARMLVVSTDTYKDLEPYFPTIEEKNGYTCYWEEVNEVYSSSQKEIYINAYYVKKQA